MEVYTWHKYGNHSFFLNVKASKRVIIWGLIAAAGPFFEQMIDSSYIVQSFYPCQNTNVSFVLNI